MHSLFLKIKYKWLFFILFTLSLIEMNICITIDCIIFIGYIIDLFSNEIECRLAILLLVIDFSICIILFDVFIEELNSNWLQIIKFLFENID